ncbi:helix-turn-helix domain-containing protein [Paenibacillus aceris]|nr:helix-turn-helix domain-containing protein [Paenibacillus aceris]
MQSSIGRRKTTAICKALECRPGDIIEFLIDEEIGGMNHGH